jgi:transposase
MAKRIRRRFTAEEQPKAVRKVEEYGRPITRVAEELGIDHRTVWQW